MARAARLDHVGGPEVLCLEQAEAHRGLEARKTTGATVLMP